MSGTQWNDLSGVGKTVLVLGGVVGYLIGWLCRAQLGMTGAVPGAIFGGGGVALGVVLAYGVIYLVPATRR